MRKTFCSGLLLGMAFSGSVALAAPSAQVITIPVNGTQKVSHQPALFSCKPDGVATDAQKKLMGILPKDFVKVDYINAGNIHLAVLPVGGEMQVFSNVMAADGAKYAGAQYVWWSKGKEATFINEMDGGAALTCKEVPYLRR